MVSGRIKLRKNFQGTIYRSNIFRVIEGRLIFFFLRLAIQRHWERVAVHFEVFRSWHLGEELFSNWDSLCGLYCLTFEGQVWFSVSPGAADLQHKEPSHSVGQFPLTSPVKLHHGDDGSAKRSSTCNRYHLITCCWITGYSNNFSLIFLQIPGVSPISGCRLSA